MTTLHEALRIADALGSIEVTSHGMNVCDRASTELRRLHAENESLKAALTSGADALTQQGEQRCDTARVLEWMRTPNRKAAQFAFTEGPERQAAYWIEIAQGEPVAQLGELGEQKPVAWAFKNEYGITLSEGDCTTLPNGVSTPLYAGSAPAVLEAVEKLERDAARMDWLAKDGDIHVFFIADTWYSRTAYGQPYRKRLNLREAIDKAMEATNGQGN